MKETTLPKRRFYSIRATAALFGRGVGWVYREMAEKRLKAVKDGRNTLITADSIAERIAAFTPAMTPTMARLTRLAGEAVEPDPVFMPISPACGPKKGKAAKAKAATTAKPKASKPAKQANRRSKTRPEIAPSAPG